MLEPVPRPSEREFERRRLAHNWLTDATDKILGGAPTADAYAEYRLRTDGANVRELLEVMRIDDLCIKPGDIIGEAKHINNPAQFSLCYYNTVPVSAEPSEVTLVVARDILVPHLPAQRYIGLSLHYDRGQSYASQIVGLAAHADGNVDAVRLEFCYRNNVCVYKGCVARPSAPNNTWTFVDCVRELFVLPRELYI